MNLSPEGKNSGVDEAVSWLRNNKSELSDDIGRCFGHLPISGVPMPKGN
jgi:hypothetical protein